MALPETYVSTSPRDAASLDAALTQMADRFILFQQSVKEILDAYSGIAVTDLQQAPYSKSAAVASGLYNGMVYLNTYSQDATVTAFIGHIRNITR